MSRLRRFIAIGLVMAVLFASIGLAGVLAEDPEPRPDGPWLQENQNVSLSSIMTNEELYAKLQHLEEVGKGKMTLEIAGYSNAPYDNLMANEGYPLYICKFGGNGDDKVKVLITSQIHGNEVLGTEAALQLMQYLIAGGAGADSILEKASIWIMPRINPDGAQFTYNGTIYPIRYSLQGWDPQSFGLDAATKAPWYYGASSSLGYAGYDQNRDYNPNTEFRIESLADKSFVTSALNGLRDANNRRYNSSYYGGFYVTPEARIVTRVYQEFGPDIYFDLHHRGFNTVSDEDPRSVSIQVAADVAEPYTDPYTGAYFSVDDDVLTLAKQVNATGWLALQKGYSHLGAIQKYPKVNLPGTALGAFALNDTAIMLIEIKGQTQSLGQKQAGALITATREAILGVLAAVADGSLYDVDPAIYDAIPESTNSIRPPDTWVPEE